MATRGSKKRPAPGSSENHDDTSATVASVSKGALMDSLPYVDPTHEDYEHYALALIEEEMKNSRAPNLDDLPPVQFRSPLMEKEYQRFLVADGEPEPTKFDWTTANLASPPSDTEDAEAWRAAVRQARSEYEAERTRAMALDARKDAGAVVLWKTFNEQLDQDLAALQGALQKQREIVEQINLRRSEEQQKYGKELHILSDKYQAALERRFQLEQAIVALENEVKQLQA